MRWLIKLIESICAPAPEHSWHEYTQDDTERRTCTVCGERHMFLEDIGMGGNYWIVVKRGNRSMHRVERPVPLESSPAPTQLVEDAATLSH